ncbi:hypothetical protein BGZ94_002393 [Podila epigama]|nr:hypothetical protein BGZ94_002393 [Podila epigama]
MTYPETEKEFRALLGDGNLIQALSTLTVIVRFDVLRVRAGGTESSEQDPSQRKRLKVSQDEDGETVDVLTTEDTVCHSPPHY